MEQEWLPVADSSSVVEPWFSSTTFVFLKTILLASGLVYVGLSAASFLQSTKLDSREPPWLAPTIPLIGHYIEMVIHTSGLLPRLAERHNWPIASLPILNKTRYAVWDSTLVQAVFRHKSLSYDPYIMETSHRLLQYNQRCHEILYTTNVLGEYMEAIHASMAPRYLDPMTDNALRYVSGRLNAMPKGQNELIIYDWWTWARDAMTVATCVALFGRDNPFVDDSPLVEDAWILEDDLSRLMLHVLPKIRGRKGVQARTRLQAALSRYYTNLSDEHEDVAEQTKRRAQVLRKYGLNGTEVGGIELALVNASNYNTAPSVFWFFLFIVSHPNAVERLRAELDPLVDRSHANTATIDVDTLAGRAPLLVSCFRETIRLTNQTQAMRRVLEDTTLEDGKGRSYLLKQGTDMEASVEAQHKDPAIWGSDSHEFNPDRFLKSTFDRLDPEVAQRRRSAYTPFGGGKHYCPGRNFAFNESLATVAALLVGFTTEPLDKSGYVIPKQDYPGLGGLSIVKPMRGGPKTGLKLRRRPGWEHVNWDFHVGLSSDRVRVDVSRP